MTNGSGAKKGLIVASAAVVGIAVCVAVVVLFAVEEEAAEPRPEDAPLVARGKLAPPGEEPEIEEEAAPAGVAVPGTAAPVPPKEIEPVEGALIEVRFRDLAAFRRSLSGLVDDVSPGLGERALAVLDANLGGRPDWLGEGPALLVVRKVTAGSYPVALSVPVRTPDGFLSAFESTVGPREDVEGGLVKFVRFGAGGEPDVDVYARVAGGRGAVSPDRDLLRDLTAEPAAPAEDLRVRIDVKGLIAAYGEDADRALAQAPPGMPPQQFQQFRETMTLMRAVIADVEGLVVGLRVDEDSLVQTTSLDRPEVGVVGRILDALVPIGRADELKWLPAEGAVTYVAGLDGEKVQAVLEELLNAASSEAMKATLQKMAGWKAGTTALSLGAGGSMSFLSAMRSSDNEEARARMERYMSEKMSWPGAGEMTLSYQRAARKVGDVEVDRGRISLGVADQQAQMVMAMMPGMLEYDFAYPRGVVLTAWGMGASELMDAAIARPAAGGPSLADSEFYKTLPPNVCAAGEFYGLRYAQIAIGMMAAFGGPAIDLGEWTGRDIPWRFLAWKDEENLHSRLTVPRSALRLYGEVVSEVAAAMGGVPEGADDPGF